MSRGRPRHNAKSRMVREALRRSEGMDALIASLAPLRPKTRGECRNAARPCPFVACVHHLKYEETETGRLRDLFPGLDLSEMRETCSLDVADRGGMTLEEVGRVLNLTRERIRQTEASALRKLRDDLEGPRLVLRVSFPSKKGDKAEERGKEQEREEKRRNEPGNATFPPAFSRS